MCGIGAFQIVEQEVNRVRLAQALLRGLTARGRDAAGIAWHSDTEQETFVQKLDVDGRRFANMIDKDLGSTAIMHTRWATQGSPKDMNNNHPIDARGVVGVHNGHVQNDKELFGLMPEYKRRGLVDSESAFAWICHGDKELTLYKRLSMIRGSAALIWLNTRGPNKLLHCARLTSSPLTLGQTEAGSVVMASTRSILLQACKEADVKLDFLYDLAEGDYFRIKNGMITQQVHIPMPHQQKFELPNYTQQSKLF